MALVTFLYFPWPLLKVLMGWLCVFIVMVHFHKVTYWFDWFLIVFDRVWYLHLDRTFHLLLLLFLLQKLGIGIALHCERDVNAGFPVVNRVVLSVGKALLRICDHFQRVPHVIDPLIAVITVLWSVGRGD